MNKVQAYQIFANQAKPNYYHIDALEQDSQLAHEVPLRPAEYHLVEVDPAGKTCYLCHKNLDQACTGKPEWEKRR